MIQWLHALQEIHNPLQIKLSTGFSFSFSFFKAFTRRGSTSCAGVHVSLASKPRSSSESEENTPCKGSGLLAAEMEEVVEGGG